MVDCIFQEIGGLYQGVGKLFVLCTFPLLVLFKKVVKLLSLIMACKVFLSVSTYGYCLQRRYQERFHRKVEKDALRESYYVCFTKNSFEDDVHFFHRKVEKVRCGISNYRIGLFEFRRWACVKK